jgi:hypothetical protein
MILRILIFLFLFSSIGNRFTLSIIKFTHLYLLLIIYILNSFFTSFIKKINNIIHNEYINDKRYSLTHFSLTKSLTYFLLTYKSDVLSLLSSSSSSLPITLPSNELSFHEIIPARSNDVTIFGNLTLEFCKSLEVPNPSYVQGIPQLLVYCTHSLTHSLIHSF